MKKVFKTSLTTYMLYMLTWSIGTLVSATYPELEKELKGSLDGVAKLTIGMKELEYISFRWAACVAVRPENHEPPRRNEAQNANEIIMDFSRLPASLTC